MELLEYIFTKTSDEFLAILKSIITSEPTTKAYRIFLEEGKQTVFSLCHSIDVSWQHTYWVLRRLRKIGLIDRNGVVLNTRLPTASANYVYELQNPLLTAEEKPK